MSDLVELSTDPKLLQQWLLEMEENPQDLYILLPGVSKWYTDGVTLRYSLKWFDKQTRDHGSFNASRGQHTYPTWAKCDSMRQAAIENNSDDRLKPFGGSEGLYVSFQACYGGHYDPAPIDVGSVEMEIVPNEVIWTLHEPADPRNMKSILRLAKAISTARKDVNKYE